MKTKRPKRSPLWKQAKKGFRGYPLATVAYYGPDNKLATKVAVGIIAKEDGEVAMMHRWVSDHNDVRFDQGIHQEILEFIKSKGVRSVVITDRIIGCPHEEGIDYPEGEKCPHCPFWANRDRWTGEVLR